MKKEITIKISLGLCNRLRTIYPFLEYCEKNNHKLNIVWPINKHCTASYFSILNPCDNLNFVEEKDCKEIDFSGWSAPEYVMNSLNSSNYYRFFSPNKSIKNQIQFFLKNINSTYNSVHIRRTDYTKRAKNQGVYIDDSIFINFIEQSLYPVYLATDCHTTQMKFCKHFGSKILVYKTIQQNTQLRQTSLEHSVIDMIMCSMSYNFLGSDYSSFSNFIYALKKSKNYISFYKHL